VTERERRRNQRRQERRVNQAEPAQEEETSCNCFDSVKMQALALRLIEKMSFFLQWKYLILFNMVLFSFAIRNIISCIDKTDDFYNMKE
jgi:hypothetical protein